MWWHGSKPRRTDKWDKLVQIFGEQAQSKLLEKIAKRLAVATGGTIAALRDGLQIAGVGQIDLSQKQPEDAA